MGTLSGPTLKPLFSTGKIFRCQMFKIFRCKMFRCKIFRCKMLQMYSLPAAFPPATSSRVWMWQGEDSLQVS